MKNVICTKHLPNSRRSKYDNFGLHALSILLILVPFHFIITEKFAYYRELFAFVFGVLWFLKVFPKSKNYDRPFLVRKEVLLFVLFPILLCFFAWIDTGKSLYILDTAWLSTHIKSTDLRMYVLRNAFLYVPMVLYFAVRGLTENEIKRIALFSLIVAPIGTLMFLQHSDISSVQGVGIIAELGGAGLSYNSYVPYLTFPVLVAMFLIASDSKKIIKALSVIILTILSVYIFLSTSRQSLIFIIIAGIFFLKTGNTKLAKKVTMLLFLLGFFLVVLQQLTQEYVISHGLFQKYQTASSIIESSRYEIMKYGLELLTPSEHLKGAGLTSVIVSGPHNDFIRWWQRIGFFAMLIGFIPFFMAAYKGYISIRYPKDNALNIFVTLSIFFTIYHSLFGYPREDAYQALYSFLGLAIWFGLTRNGLVVYSPKSLWSHQTAPDSRKAFPAIT